MIFISILIEKKRTANSFHWIAYFNLSVGHSLIEIVSFVLFCFLTGELICKQ